MTSQSQRLHNAFTLVELLVVIAIIGVLVALILPAVQMVRQSAMRVECVNNLKQIGLAAHQYHDSRRAFPPGMRFQAYQDPHLMSSWLTELLPYLEQQNLWSLTQEAYEKFPSPFQNPPHVGLATVLPIFVCPADGRGYHPHTTKKENIQRPPTAQASRATAKSTRSDDCRWKPGMSRSMTPQ